MGRRHTAQHARCPPPFPPTHLSTHPRAPGRVRAQWPRRRRAPRTLRTAPSVTHVPEPWHARAPPPCRPRVAGWRSARRVRHGMRPRAYRARCITWRTRAGMHCQAHMAHRALANRAISRRARAVNGDAAMALLLAADMGTPRTALGGHWSDARRCAARQCVCNGWGWRAEQNGSDLVLSVMLCVCRARGIAHPITTTRPAIAQLVEHLAIECCRNQMVPGSILGGRS